ncbi:MAG: OmpA family protein [Luteibaculum sp.]
MRPIVKQIALASIALPLMVSCVSSRKYEEALNREDQLTEENRALLSDLNRAKDNLAEYQSKLNKKEKESASLLTEKELELQERERKLEQLEALVREQKMAVQALHQEVCSALKCFTPDELKVDVRDGKLYVSMSEQLLFPSGSANVNDRGQEAVEMLSTVLKNSDLEIMIEGHTDNVPIKTDRFPDNWALSVARANAVTRLMVNSGIDPERVISSGRGEFAPIASNATAEGKQKNRRTEIVLAPRLDRLWKLTEAENINTTALSK